MLKINLGTSNTQVAFTIAAQINKVIGEELPGVDLTYKLEGSASYIVVKPTKDQMYAVSSLGEKPTVEIAGLFHECGRDEDKMDEVIEALKKATDLDLTIV